MNLKSIVFPLSALGTGIGLIVIFKDSLSGARHGGEEKLHGRTVVITGTTSGLGKETARNLAKRGGRIVMGCRDIAKCLEIRDQFIEETYNKNIVCHKLDLASLKSIRAFAEEINKSEKRIDILINNAGVMALPNRELTEDGFEYQLGVNYLGHFLLTNLLLDKIKASAPSRIINTTCVAFKKATINFNDLNCDKNYEPKEAYGQSKLALYNFTKELAERLKGHRVSVYNVHPGLCFTNIGRHMGMNKSRLSSSVLYPLWWFLLKNPDQGIQTTLHCALEPYEQYFTGNYYEECTLNDTLPGSLSPKETSERLWAISERWTRLKEQ